MVYIFKDRLIRVEWTIYKGISPVKEDFSRSNVKVFLLGNREKYLLQARADKGTLYVDIPSGLEEGTYSIEAIWVKNMDHVFDTRSVCRSKKEDLFSITEFEDEATNIGEGVVVLKVKTSTATYGYDGLSSYELAVLRGDWNGTEGEWLKHERYVSVLDSRGDSEVDTMSQKAITDELEAQDNAIEDIREDTGKLGERVEEAEEKVNNMGDVVDEIKNHAPVSARPAGFKPDIDLTPEITVDRAWRDHEGNVIRDTYITRRGLRNEIIDITNQQVTDLKPGSVDPDDLSEATKQLIGNKSITNLPDEEDITVTDNQTLKLKDKEYAPKDYSGMGRVYLRKHYVNGVNTLTQHMMRKPNTIYIIQYDYCLAGQTIEVPENCVLDFQGGSLRNGKLIGYNTRISGKTINIFDNIKLGGRFLDDLNPLSFNINLLDWTSTYDLLYSLHTTAISMGVNVNYKDVRRINIEIPSVFNSIPLSNTTDFNNCEFHIRNNSKDCYLFARGDERPLITLDIDPILLKGVDYSSVPELNNGKFILIVKDNNLWSKRILNQGDLNIYRYDVIIIQDGFARNIPIQPYDTIDSDPIFYAVDVREDKNPTICNGKFFRENSTKLTKLFNIKKVDGMMIKDLYVYTDKNNVPKDMKADATFYFNFVTNLTLDNVYQMNTYSDAVNAITHGYFLSVFNGFNIKLININAHDNDWGVIGCRCINTAFVDKSSINRFDIHTYGTHVTIRDSIISNKFCQIGDYYGDIVFDNCIFNKCSSPLFHEHTYNYMTKYNIYLKNCTINGSDNLVHYLYSHMDIAPIRVEQNKKYLPNIYIEGLTVNLLKDKVFKLILNNGNWKKSSLYEGIYGLENVVLKNLVINYDKDDSREYTYMNLQYEQIDLLSCPNIVIDNCVFGKVIKGSELKLINSNLNVETLRVQYTLLRPNTKGKFTIKNSLMALPTKEYCPYDFIVENSDIINVSTSFLEENKYNNYMFVNCNLHFNRYGNTLDEGYAGNYVNCKFLMYRDKPSIYFESILDNWETNIINCSTNKQDYGTILYNNPFIPYSVENSHIIKNEFKKTRLSKTTINGTSYVLLEQDTPESIEKIPYDAYNYARFLREKSLPLNFQRVKISGEEDAKWVNKAVSVIIAGSTNDMPKTGSITGLTYYDWDKRKLFVWSGERWRNAGTGFESKFEVIGSTNSRPTDLSIDEKGFQYYDTILNKPIWWTGTNWVDATGATV